jgi:hypothetical protein
MSMSSPSSLLKCFRACITVDSHINRMAGLQPRASNSAIKSCSSKRCRLPTREPLPISRQALAVPVPSLATWSNRVATRRGTSRSTASRLDASHGMPGNSHSVLRAGEHVHGGCSMSCAALTPPPVPAPPMVEQMTAARAPREPWRCLSASLVCRTGSGTLLWLLDLHVAS